MVDQDQPVWVIDLTDAELEQCQAETSASPEEDGGRGPAELTPLDQPIAQVALLIEGLDEPFLLPIAETSDTRLLDALARLMKIAVVSGERIPAVAINYGEEYERRLAFERSLPGWAYSGVDQITARRLPPQLQTILRPPPDRSETER